MRIAFPAPSIPSLHTVDPLCPGSVEQVVMKALATEPALRFQSAEEFRSKLLACLLEIDPSAGPESVSRFMRETFAAEYQQERRLLATLREQIKAAMAANVHTAPKKAPSPPAMRPT